MEMWGLRIPYYIRNTYLCNVISNTINEKKQLPKNLTALKLILNRRRLPKVVVVRSESQLAW